jgi:predicted NUDIX family NTP pyrophosphohydrolase
VKEFPEVDRAGWFTLDEAEDKILKGQKAILEDFVDRQARRGPPLA